MPLEVADVCGGIHAPNKQAILHLVNPGPVLGAGAGKNIQDARWVTQVWGSEKLHSYCVNCSEKIIFRRVMSFINICVFTFVTQLFWIIFSDQISEDMSFFIKYAFQGFSIFTSLCSLIGSVRSLGNDNLRFLSAISQLPILK